MPSLSLLFHFKLTFFTHYYHSNTLLFMHTSVLVVAILMFLPEEVSRCHSHGNSYHQKWRRVEFGLRSGLRWSNSHLHRCQFNLISGEHSVQADPYSDIGPGWSQCHWCHKLLNLVPISIRNCTKKQKPCIKLLRRYSCCLYASLANCIYPNCNSIWHSSMLEVCWTSPTALVQLCLMLWSSWAMELPLERITGF